MPGHEGAVPGLRYRRWRVPWVGRTRAVAPCLLCEVLAVILVLRSGVALALALAWHLFRDCGSLGPRFLLPGFCGGGAGLGLPGPARLGGSLLQSWCLGLGPGCLVCRLPSVSFPWVGSTVGFLGSVSTSWESLVPYSVAFDSFSSSSSLHLSARALPEERVGVLVWVFIHQPPCLLILQHGSQVGHTGSPSLLSYNLLFILQVSILSEQMVFCVS